MLTNLFKEFPWFIHNIIPSPHFPQKLKLDSKP